MARAGKAKTGRGSRPVSEILAESRRETGSCPHVERPHEPVLLFGLSVDDLEKRINNDLAEAKQHVGKAIRKDQRVMISMVTSHPASIEQFNTDEEIANQVDAWCKKTVEWARDWAKEQGGELVTAIAHIDEAYPHLHMYILPRPDAAMKADKLHPGRAAQAAAEAAALSAGMEKKFALREGDRAYRESMRAFQDDYYTAVGVECGLTRIGPARRRLSREAWQEEKQASVKVAASIAEAKEAAQGVWNFAVEKLGKAETREIELHTKLTEYQQATDKLNNVSNELKRERDRIVSMSLDIKRTYDEVTKVVSAFKAEALALVEKAVELLPYHLTQGIKNKIKTLDDATQVLPGLVKKLDDNLITRPDFFETLQKRLEPLPPRTIPASARERDDDSPSPSPFD